MQQIIKPEQVLPANQVKTAEFLREHIFAHLPQKHFFLVGGTALALQYGHRQSVDFDFFSFPQQETTDPTIETVDKLFRRQGIYQRRDVEVLYGQLHYQINGVAVLFSVFQNFSAEYEQEFYRIPLLPTEKTAFDFDIPHILDLAGMKAFARCHRSKMKDLVDLAEILTHDFSLSQVISITEQQFGHDISGKEILNACINIEDVRENILDEPIVFLQDQNVEDCLAFLKTKALELCNGDS